ncbi:hypothetical protein [Alterinioella nitratireducens]|jgi:hypothetical protein|uniref:hypothetical protein n=1 Tax=Alterinioella nitratireducens TaxID=2735915 RepID=UPI000C8E9458|nr:hypothetical protein [Dinoroseobacter sp.]|tara:strand:- start:132 stop:356 length:225 start_codon:yes stop_codon:yes gene_type:complete
MSDHFGNIELNSIQIVRKGLSFDEAVAVWLMHWSGVKQHVIAARFGTNGGRIADVLTEKKHVGSRQAAAVQRFS